MTQSDPKFLFFDLLSDANKPRLQGLTSWEQIPLLGTANIERVIQLAQENVNALMAVSAPRNELRAVADGIGRLREALASASKKPLLPRLRAETFRQGHNVKIYVGDSEGCIAPTAWVDAVITQVQKSHKPEFVDGTPNNGFYWRSTATTKQVVFSGQNTLAFSTTEPRVLLVWEFDFLQKATKSDTEFLEIFAVNARRIWCPIWCLERHAGCAGEAMDMKTWLLEGSA